MPLGSVAVQGGEDPGHGLLQPHTLGHPDWPSLLARVGPAGVLTPTLSFLLHPDARGPPERLSLSPVPEEVAEGRSLSLSGTDRIVNTRMFHAVDCREMSQPLPTATAPCVRQPCLSHRASSCRGRTSSGPLASKPSPSACQPACRY